MTESFCIFRNFNLGCNSLINHLALIYTALVLGDNMIADVIQLFLSVFSYGIPVPAEEGTWSFFPCQRALQCSLLLICSLICFGACVTMRCRSKILIKFVAHLASSVSDHLVTIVAIDCFVELTLAPSYQVTQRSVYHFYKRWRYGDDTWCDGRVPHCLPCVYYMYLGRYG